MFISHVTWFPEIFLEWYSFLRLIDVERSLFGLSLCHFDMEVLSEELSPTQAIIFSFFCCSYSQRHHTSQQSPGGRSSARWRNPSRSRAKPEVSSDPLCNAYARTHRRTHTQTETHRFTQQELKKPTSAHNASLHFHHRTYRRSVAFRAAVCITQHFSSLAL